MLRAGVDLGGTKIQVAIVDKLNRVLGTDRRPTPTVGTPDGVTDTIASSVKAAVADAGVDLEDLVGVDVVLDGQLARGDDALGLVADVKQDLIAVDLDDDSFDDVSVVEVLDRRVDGGEEVFLRADVVDGDLRGGLLDRAGSHVVGTPMWTDGIDGIVRAHE